MQRRHHYVPALVLLAAMTAGCATRSPDGLRVRPEAKAPQVQPSELLSREAAVRELRTLGAEPEYALNILPDGTDPPGRVRRVRFAPGTCTDQALRHVAAFPELERLELYQQPVSDNGLRSVSGLTNLRWLGLSGTRVTGAGIRHLMPLQRLEALSLEGQLLDENAFRQIATLQHLTTLRVDRTSLDDARLMLLTPLRDLEYLSVFNTKVTAGGAARFNEVLPHVTVHRFQGQQFVDRRPATRPVRPTEWSRDLVKQTFLWPLNFLSGAHWEGQALEHREIIKVLEQKLPAVDKENADQPLFEVVAKVTNRRIVWIPAQSEEERGRQPTYGEAISGEASRVTVGQLFGGLLTVMSEAGGPSGVSVIGRRKGVDDEGPDDGPYLIYSLYVTKEYIAIVALPADRQ
jgi:hypothetical protein